MPDDQRLPSQNWLPAATPDLIAAGDLRSGFRVVRISPQLARLAPDQPTEGGLLARLYPESQPDLDDLAREAVTEDRVITGVLVRLRPDLPPLLADIEPAGLSADFRQHLVHLRLRPTRELPAVGGAATGLIGNSPALREVLRKIALYAPSDAPVIVTGETGTGKELVARALHDRSPRRGGPYVAVNCSAISEELLESELFGHEKGAFTGAIRSHRGRFERADRGTLFLDEIGEMPLHTQAKLLRVLEEGTVERVGAEREQRVDVRVVAATNVPLERAVGEGRFRADLYHRLAVLRLHLPPLRERLDDLPLLVDHFLAASNRKYGRNVQRLTPEAMELLRSYYWPGNIRELRNVLERVFVETRTELIGARAFGEWIRERNLFAPGRWEPTPPPVISAGYLAPLPATRPAASTRPADLDTNEIHAALAAAGGNLSGAARLLGVHRATLYRYMDKLGIDRKATTPAEKDGEAAS